MPAPAPPAAAVSRDDRDHTAEAIVVTGVRRRAEDVLGGVSVLGGQQLTTAIRPSIGDTLTRLPGVSASSFGPTASRPILRGLGGDRIRLLTDGIGSFDVSASSADHAAAINPLTADRIEVLRGPAALAVRIVGDRRGGQCDRFANPAPGGGAAPCRRAARLRQRRQRAVGRVCRCRCRSASSCSTAMRRCRAVTICVPAGICCPTICATRRGQALRRKSARWPI